MSRTNCPSREELCNYCYATLEPERADELADHVERCQLCDATLRQLEAQSDTLLSVLRPPEDDDPYLREPDLARAFELAAAIVPARSSTTPTSAAQAPPPEPGVAEQLRDYRLLARLGQGGWARSTKPCTLDWTNWWRSSCCRPIAPATSTPWPVSSGK